MKRGYEIIWLGVHSPFANKSGYQYTHRFIVMISLGYKLRSDEHVHHIDGDRANNLPINLKVVVAVYHGRLHAYLIDLMGWRNDKGQFTYHLGEQPYPTHRQAAIVGPAANPYGRRWAQGGLIE